MRSLSRGLRPNLMVLPRPTNPPCQCAWRLLFGPRQQDSRPRRICQTTRNFSTTHGTFARISSTLGAARPAVRQTTPSSRSTTTSFAQQLAAKGVPTILFEAPSHKWYMGSCLTAGFFMTAIGAFWYLDVLLYPPEGLSLWVRWTFGGIVVFCGALGAFFFSGALGIVSLVRAVPRTYAVAKMAKLMPKTPPASGPQDVLLIEVSTRRVVPFFGPRRVLAPADTVHLSPNTLKLLVKRASAGTTSSAKAHKEKMAEIARREEARRYEMSHLLTAPFRHFFRALRYAFVGLRRGVMRDGFQTMLVDGKKRKLDVRGGWALEDGRAMARVLPVEPSS